MAQADDHSTDHYGKAVSSNEEPHPGDIIRDDAAMITPEPLAGRDESTPLEEDEPEGTIPPAALWAMKDRRHIQWHLIPHGERHDRVREVFGSGDASVYAIDDGKHHAMVAHLVGSSPSGATYVVLGRVERAVLTTLTASTNDVFATAKELALIGVVQEESIKSSNVFDVERYEAPDEIPESYLPGAPFEKFSGDLEITIA